MKKKIIFMSVVLATVLSTFATITISTSAKTFDKSGGAASITIAGDGAWKATSDSTWITIAQGASGTGAGSCVYVVSANTTADTRIGHITVAENVYTITQHGYSATISPTAATYDRFGGSGSIDVAVEAGISWNAVSNDKWIKVSSSSGISVGTVNYDVSEYVGGVVTRVGSITIGGQTFTVTQMGVDVSISPESVVKAASAGIISVSITALVGTKWDVVANDPWISIIDKATGYGDYVLTLAIASNPSFERRTGTVSIGSATLTVIQDGLSTASLSINPEKATASASGAYGNVAVYATPDAPWTATSLTPWLTISEGSEGAGNGNIKYVASANPTLEGRTGQILIMPPHKVVDPDLYRGLLFWIKENDNVEGNDGRGTTYPLSKSFDGSFMNQLTGANLPARESFDFTFACQFKVGELNRVNRLFQLGRSPRQFYLDEQNVLHYDYSANDSTLYSSVTPFRVAEANKWYTILIRHEHTKETGGELSIYCGESGGMLTRFNKKYEGAFFPLNKAVSISASFVLGYTTLPTTGYLTAGQFGNLRFWNRALSDFECDRVDVLQSANQCENKVPAGVPEGVKWRFWPLDGNGYRTLDSTMNAQVVSTTLYGWSDFEDRFGTSNSSLTSAGDGLVRLVGFETFFEGSSILNKGSALTSVNYGYSSDYRYYPHPATASADAILDATYSIWFCPYSLDGLIMSRIVDDRDGKGNSISPQSKNTSLILKLVDGKIELSGTGVATTKFSKAVVKANEWHMLSIVGKAESSIQVYLDGSEIGNVSSPLTLGYLPKIDQRCCNGYNTMYGSVENCARMDIGGFPGAIDDFAIYQAALTSEQVRELYNRQRDLKVYHTVSQGVQIAQLNKTKDTAPAEGCTSSVSLTLAQIVKWEAKSNNDWITITSGTEGAGSATIEFTVGANPAVTQRTGSITVAGVTLTITQEPLWADVSCEDTSFGVESGSGFIWVDTEGAGQWTAKTDANWIHLLSDSGNGPDTVLFVVDDYATTTESRSGKITIAGKQVIVTQQGYELSIDPKVADLGSNAGAGQFGVAAPIDAVWEAIADCEWITIIGSRNGIGNGIIQYSVADNTTGETRTGRIIVSGQAYTITQKTTLPVVASVLGQGAVEGAGDYTQGTDITLKATAAKGYVFSHWSGDVVGSEPNVVIKVDIAKNVTATFIPEAAAQKLAEEKAAQGGFYTRDQIHALEMGNLVFDVDASGTARVGVQLMETSDLTDPNSWKPATLNGNPDVGQDGTVGMKVKAEGNAKFFKVVMPDKQ